MTPKNADLDRLIARKIYLIVFLMPSSTSPSPVPCYKAQCFLSAFLLTVLSLTWKLLPSDNAQKLLYTVLSTSVVNKPPPWHSDEKYSELPVTPQKQEQTL